MAATKRGRRLGLIVIGLAFLLVLRFVEPAAEFTFQGQKVSSLQSLNAILFLAIAILYMMAALSFCHASISDAIIRRAVNDGKNSGVLLSYSYGSETILDIDRLVQMRARQINDKASMKMHLVARGSFVVYIIVSILLTFLPVSVNWYYVSTLHSQDLPFGMLGLLFCWAFVLGQIAAFVGALIYDVQYRQFATSQFATRRSGLR